MIQRRKERIVVVGNGMAGGRLVEELVARGASESREIVVFGEEPYGNYNRILLSDVLAGRQDPENIFLNPLDWYEQHGVTLHAGVRVQRIDLERRLVFGEGNVDEAFDVLVLATGSRAFVPPIEGVENDGVHVFRTLDDCRDIAGSARKSRSAAVVGGGLLGLEAAHGLKERGVEEVHVVHLAGHLMESQLDAPGGGILEDRVRGMGFRVHTRKETRRVLGDGRVRGLAFDDGSELACDMVVVSAGIRPNAELAEVAGLAVGRGVTVGDDLKCPGRSEVYALGECAEHRGATYGLVAPLWEQAAVLADRLSGRNPEARYEGSRVATKLKVAGVDLNVMGERDAAPGDEVVRYVEEAGGVYKRLLVRDGRLAGAILLGDASRATHLLQMFDREAEVPANRSELLFPPATDDATPSVEELPDDAQICNCNGVSKGRIAAEVDAGCRSLNALCDRTRAGTGCGSCKELVAAVLAHAGDGITIEDPAEHYYVPAVPLAKPDLLDAVRERGLKSVSAVLAELGSGEVDARSKTGLASLLKTLWGAEYDDERDARFINDRVHANIQNDGTFSVVPGIAGGVTSPEQLRRIADVAEKYDVGMVKVTGGQRIDLLGVPKDRLPAVWEELGMKSGHAYAKSVRTVKTCVGTEFCRYGLGESTRLGIALEERYRGLDCPHKVKMGVAGCPRNCSEALIKDVGVVAVEGGRWEIYVGGAGGSHVRKGDLLCVVDTHEEVIRLVGRFVQYYRENGKYMERTYDFVPRLGVEPIRAVVVEDSEGIADRLDAAMDASVEAYTDPWIERTEPYHPTQFATNLKA